MLNALGEEHGARIRHICAWLVEHFRDDVGLWGYPDGVPDLSNTQYAALALKVGERHGYRTPPSIWKRLIDTVMRLQAEGGGVRYRGGDLYRATMTHAGLLILRFAHEALGRKPSRKARDAVKRGQRYVEETFSVDRTPFGRGWNKNQYYYYMYGLERYAQYFGLKKIAGHDWYREGAEALLARQHDDGFWGNLEDTAFAILFLRRAKLTPPDARELGTVEE